MMSLRCIEYFSKVIIPTLRGHQIYRPFLTYLLQNNYVEKRIPIRNISTETTTIYRKVGIFQRIVENIKLQLKKNKLKAVGYLLYESIADQLDYINFMKELRMPDTFHSWFLVTELHVWMIMAMLMGDPTQGRYLRNTVVEAMWNDISTRAKKLGKEQPSVIKAQIQQMSEEFQAALVTYDEGLLSSDTVLAGAIWRRFLMRNPSCTASDLEIMVKYIRKSMLHLDKWDVNDFLKKKNLKWIPLKEIYEDLPR